MTDQFKKFDPAAYWDYPAPLNVTQREVQIIYTALSAVSPSGGGSAPFTLARKVIEQTPYGIDAEMHNRQLKRFCDTVIEEAEEAGAVKTVSPYALKPLRLIIAKKPDATDGDTHPFEFIVEFEGKHPSQWARTQCRDERQCMCMVTATQNMHCWNGGKHLPVEWRDGITLDGATPQ